SSIVVAYIYLGLFCLDAFAVVQLMTIGPGGPNETTTVMALSIYKSFKEQGQFGYATAQGVVMFLITLVLAVLTLRIMRGEQIDRRPWPPPPPTSRRSRPSRHPGSRGSGA